MEAQRSFGFWLQETVMKVVALFEGQPACAHEYMQVQRPPTHEMSVAS